MEIAAVIRPVQLSGMITTGGYGDRTCKIIARNISIQSLSTTSNVKSYESI